MNYFHSYWTRPLLDPTRPAEEQELVWWDFEALTWLWSALEIRRHASLRLVTDTRGLLAVRRAGLDWVYDAGISTALDDLPASVDARVFWAAGKLHAHRVVPAPCVGVDTDAILWRPLRPTAPVMALHAEDRRWWWYARDRELFGGFGFGGPEWDWTCDPVNAAVVYLADAALQRRYADTALRFMGACSELPSATGIPPNAMLFAEQRLLPMCARQMGRPLAFITTLQGGLAWLPCGADCLHLWGAKQAYKLCPEARVAAVNHLRARILRRFPIARPTLNRWGLGKPILPPEPDPAQRTTVLCAPPEGLTFSLLREVQGRVWVNDRVTGARRLAVEDGMIWSGEELEPEPGASCVLLVGGTQSLRLGARAATVSERSCYATAN